MTFVVYYRNIQDWAVNLVQDPIVGPNFVFHAQRLSKFDGTTFVRFYDEPWTADDFWNSQVNIGDLPDDQISHRTS